MSEEETRQIYLVIALSLLFIFMVTAGLFESLIHPLVVMVTIPMGLIGVFLIYWLTGKNFDRGAYIGVVLLGGIVVNNAILLVARIRQLQWEGYELYQAVMEAAQNRFRPILMTSLTTILGLLPLIINAQTGTLWSTLALSTVGGLLSSTLLVLVVTPVLYVFGERLKERVKKIPSAGFSGVQ